MRQIRAFVIALLCLPLTACFEEPVREHLHLMIRVDGSVVATVVQEVAGSEWGHNNQQLAERLEGSREILARNLDPWSQRFANLSPVAEHQSVETLDGELRRSIHSAVFASFDEVVRLVEADGLTGNLVQTGRAAELQLFPTGGTRATYFQRQDADRLLRQWSAGLADYFNAVIDLYAYLDQQPERALPCFAHTFEKTEGLGETGTLTSVEEKLVVQAKDAMEQVADALLVGDDEAFSLNELSRLVYDPFPARLTVDVDADVLDSSGFISGNGCFERPAVDVWNALKALEGRWISPDLVTAAAAPAPEDQQPEPDILFLSSQPRRYSSPPTSAEVESAILAELVPQDMLQLRWRVPSQVENEADLPSDDWLEVIAAAEANIPD
jgi:hypothetical protein